MHLLWFLSNDEDGGQVLYLAFQWEVQLKDHHKQPSSGKALKIISAKEKKSELRIKYIESDSDYS